MRSFVKAAALLVALTCAVWIAVLWRWRSTQHDMDAGDAVVYLGLLPIVVFGLALGVRWAVRSALARQDAGAAGAVAAAPGGTPAAAETTDETAPAAWHLLGAWTHTAGGTSVDELLAAIEAGAPRPGPDDALNDEDGLPVITARIAGLATELVESELQRHAEALPQAVQGSTAPRAVRALAILSPLLDDLAQSLQPWSESWADRAAPGQTPADARSTGASSDRERTVRVIAAWPTDWDEPTCALARSWLSDRLGAGVSPALRWSTAAQRMSGTELLSAAQRTVEALRRDERDDPVVLIACHSDLDDAGIQALEAGQRLFHSTRRPRVSMAGEGAAVLAVSAVSWPPEAALETERVRLASPASSRRSQSIEGAGRTTSDDAVGLVRLALARAGLSGEAVAKLASDADQHTARTTELFAVTLALLPELDANDDLRLAGSVAGRLEAVAPLLTLACAAAQARDSGKPAVALSLADPHWRVAAVLVPESFASAAAPA